MTSLAIFRRDDITALQKVVLAVLHARADESGRVAVTNREIAAYAATVGPVARRSLAALERAGLLVVERRGQKARPQIVRLHA